MKVDRAIVPAMHSPWMQGDIHREPADRREMRRCMTIKPYRRSHKHYSIDQLGLLDIRALKIPSVELVAGEVVATLQGDRHGDRRFRADDHLRDLPEHSVPPRIVLSLRTVTTLWRVVCPIHRLACHMSGAGTIRVSATSQTHHIALERPHLRAARRF